MDSRISEVTVENIMVNMGFIEENNNNDIEVVQTIWQHLEREEFAEPQARVDDQEEE